ncbi:MAG TPA: cation:proton antiporter [Streptosporangiaceae bacterium]|nr:cation:proton antiporter [Streptosporangiaceae bacterium]
MTTSEVLLGVGLILALAAGSEVLAGRLRLPAIVLLLPVGFIAGVFPGIDPQAALGAAYQPMLSLGIAILLFNAGLNLNLRLLTGQTRQIVVRLLVTGVPATMALVATAAGLLGLETGAAIMMGAILVPASRSVTAPLLGFVRPAQRLRHALVWEAALLSPVGAILCTVVLHGVIASNRPGAGAKAEELISCLAVGLGGGIAGTLVLWVLVRKLALRHQLGTGAVLATVAGLAAACDALSSAAGIIAAALMGLFVANLRGFDLPVRRPFLEAVIVLVRDVLLLSIAATVSVDAAARQVLPALALTGVLVLLARPLIALAATRATDLTRRERLFTGWMAPRGIVSVATAAVFVALLAAYGVTDSGRILPLTLLVVMMTIVFYAAAAVPTARLLGVLRSPASRPLLIGGDDWAIDLGRALQLAGLDVLMWAGLEEQRERIREATLHLAPRELLTAITGDRAELSGITTVLLMTDEDDFNALAAAVLRYAVGDRVFWLGPPADGRGVIAPFAGGNVLFSAALNRSTLSSLYAEGARITARRDLLDLPAGDELLFLVHPDGGLEPATRRRTPAPHQGDTVVLLSSANR